MSDEIVARTEIGYLGLPVEDIFDLSSFQQNEVANGCPAVMRLTDIEWTAKNQAAIFQYYNGLTSGFEVYEGTALESKKATWGTATKDSVPYLLPLGFGAFTLDDIMSSPQKYQNLNDDIANCLADLIEANALTEFAKTAVKTAVNNSAKVISAEMWLMAMKNFGKFQRRQKCSIVHPDVFAKVNALATKYSEAGPNATLVSGTLPAFAGTLLYQSNHVPAPSSGVYTSYIALNGAYQYGLPQNVDIKEKSERGTLERYLDASLAYVDYTPGAIGGTIKRVLEVKHLLESGSEGV